MPADHGTAHRQAYTQLELPIAIDERPVKNGLAVFARSPSVVPTEVYRTYWSFAAERQEVFFRRAEGKPSPWTEDPILRHYKFTNAYRASDRVSQYLIRYVIYSGNSEPKDVFFRSLLFKLFNRIETWELLESELGCIRWADYSYTRYDRILSRAMEANERIYSPAYIMPPGRNFGHPRKHQNHLKLLEHMMRDDVPQRIQEETTMRGAFELLRSYPSIGYFLGYQFVIDLNYSELTNFSEMEFVVPGPGALDGIYKCFSSLGELREDDLIRLVTDSQEDEFVRMGIKFRPLWGRPLQLIDCQNLFCEVGKYARVAHPEVRGRAVRTRIKQRYRSHSDRINYWYPPKWGLNDRIQFA